MEQLSPGLYLPAIIILLSLLSTATGIIGYFLKDIKAAQKEKDQQQDKAIDDLKDVFNDFKSSLPRQYVLRDDFIRAIAGLDAKMDNVTKEIGEINKNLSKLIGGQNVS